MGEHKYKQAYARALERYLQSALGRDTPDRTRHALRHVSPIVLGLPWRPSSASLHAARLRLQDVQALSALVDLAQRRKQVAPSKQKMLSLKGCKIDHGSPSVSKTRAC